VNVGILGSGDVAKALARGLVGHGHEAMLGSRARAIEPLCMLWCIPGFLRQDWVHAFKLLS